LSAAFTRKGSQKQPEAAFIKIFNSFKMLELFLAILLALSCPNHSNSHQHGNGGTQVTTMDDTGGEAGHIPPHPPRP